VVGIDEPWPVPACTLYRFGGAGRLVCRRRANNQMLSVALVPDDISLAAMGAQLPERRYLCLAFEAETITRSNRKTRKLHSLFLHGYLCI